MATTSRKENYSTLEVDKEKTSEPPVAKEDEAELPQVIEQSAPEVVEKGAPTPANRKPRICGLRKPIFWALLAAVILIIIGAAIGGGVGGGLAARHKSSSSSSSSSTNTTQQPAGPPQILSTSNIAAVNYTDAQNVTHRRVYFQADTTALYQSDYDASTSSWTVTPASAAAATTSDSATAAAPKNATSLSAHVNIQDASTNDLDFHLFFIDTDDTIRELTSNASSSYSSWTPSSFRLTLPVATSALVSSAKQCAACSADNALVYQSQQNNENTLNAVNRTVVSTSSGGGGETDEVKLIAGDVSPVLGSGMGLAQLLPEEGGGEAELALYVNAGSLQEVVFNGTAGEWVVQGGMEADGVVASLSDEAHIAAWCTVVDGVRYVKVMSTTSSGGVQLVAWSGAAGAGWTQTSSLEVFEDVVRNSAVAFTEDGRVFAFEEGDGGAGVQLVEWAYVEGSTWERVGVVNTTIS